MTVASGDDPTLTVALEAHLEEREARLNAIHEKLQSNADSNT